MRHTTTWVMATTLVFTVFNAYAQAYDICTTPNGGTTFCKTAAPPNVTPQPMASASLMSQVAPVAPVTPPPVQVATPQAATAPWWCSNGRPQNPTEATICQNPSLHAWDSAYNQVWKNLPSSVRPTNGALADRDKHGTDVAAIQAWYIQQMQQLAPTSGQPVALSSGAATFDWCRKRLNEFERVLCQVGTDELANLDRQLQAAFNQKKAVLKGKSGEMVSQQNNWINQRNLIVSAGVSNPQAVQLQLKQAYSQRLSELLQ
jgi:uncharacterized protein